jgi:hypothetical protein
MSLLKLGCFKIKTSWKIVLFGSKKPKLNFPTIRCDQNLNKMMTGRVPKQTTCYLFYLF